MELSDAVTVSEPAATNVTKPALLTVATVGVADVHVTEELTSLVLPSLKVPVAVSCTVAPGGPVLEDGFTVMLLSTRVTVAATEAATPELEAEKVTWPAETPVARPEAEIVATALLEELQLTVAVTLLLLPSL
jgi:hypothetical protein